MAEPQRRVIKLGGSLLSTDDWIGRLTRWLEGQPAATSLVVVGGGRPVREIAAEQRRSALDDVEVHWRCVRAMQAHAETLADALPGRPWLRHLADLDERRSVPATFVVDPWTFLKDDDARLGTPPLPQTWDVTSDSIAARLADLARADELVLLKSALPADMSHLGDYVDRYFAEAAKNLPAIRFVNLREPTFPEARYR